MIETKKTIISLSNKRTNLILEKSIESSNPITICVRLKFRRQIRNRVIFSGNGNKLRLTLLNVHGYGWFVKSGKRFIFKIPKNHLEPYKWHHLCLKSDRQSYSVYADGEQWYQQNHSYIQGVNKKWTP